VQLLAGGEVVVDLFLFHLHLVDLG
jgi:hypothetical protein